MLEKYILSSKVLKVDAEKKTVTLEIEFDMSSLAKDLEAQIKTSVSQFKRYVEEFAEVFRYRLSQNQKKECK